MSLTLKVKVHIGMSVDFLVVNWLQQLDELDDLVLVLVTIFQWY